MHQSDKSLPSWLLIALFSFWVFATLIGLWWFQQDKLKAFADLEADLEFFQPQSIDLILRPYLVQADSMNDNKNPANQRTLIHFWRPDCLCNRISQRHFARLINQYSPEQLRIVIIAHPKSTNKEIDQLKMLNGDRFIVLKAGNDLLSLPSSPSLAIYDPSQNLNYFGPYGFGAFCNVREDGFLSSIIDNPNANSFTNVIGDGCFCSWKD